MNILLTSQGVEIEVMSALFDKLTKSYPKSQGSLYVADSMFYDAFLKRYRGNLEEKFSVLKEWEIVQKAKQRKADLSKLKEYEKELTGGTLWDLIVSDRRVYMGKRCKSKQDYKPFFDHDTMLSIVQTLIEEQSRFLDEQNPDIIFSMDIADIGKYCLYLLAKKRNIPMHIFRTTKIKNYIEVSENLFEPSEKLKKTYKDYALKNIQDDSFFEAKEYLEKVKKEFIRYEGMIFIPSKRKTKGQPLFRKWRNILRSEKNYRKHYREDHHVTGNLIPMIYKDYLTPWKNAYQCYRLKKYFVRLENVQGSFAFYPMQSEPEIATLVWGKACMNQIEVIRNIARSLPLGMKLLVKEHPRSMGYRKFGYYEKILQIPNVCLVEPDQEVRNIIQKSTIVISISTFVGFEAVLLEKPSIMLGGPRPFTILPDSMIRYSSDINLLPQTIQSILQEYHYDENATLNYLASVMKTSVAVEFYSVLLRKGGRHTEIKTTFDDELAKLADFLTRHFLGNIKSKKTLVEVGF